MSQCRNVARSVAQRLADGRVVLRPDVANSRFEGTLTPQSRGISSGKTDRYKVGSGGVLWSHSRNLISFSDKHLRRTSSASASIASATGGLIIPRACGQGHPLTPD